MIDGIKSEFLRRAIEMHIQNWNALVPAKYLYHSETPTHFIFRHPTKASVASRRSA